MPQRSGTWTLIALIASILINIGLFGLTTMLSHERRWPRDITDPLAVNLVSLAPPEPLRDEKIKEPERPKPQHSLDFTPEVVRPRFSGRGGMDVGIEINIGSIGSVDAGGEFIFEAYELDQAPQVIVRVPPVYPYKAREQGVEGAVQVKLLVNKDGTVGRVMILDARPGGIFEDAVRKAVPRWKFNPGTIEGNAVTAWVVTTVRFTF